MKTDSKKDVDIECSNVHNAANSTSEPHNPKTPLTLSTVSQSTTESEADLSLENHSGECAVPEGDPVSVTSVRKIKNVSGNWMEWANLPRASLPPEAEYFPVEKFVSDAVLSRHGHAAAADQQGNAGVAGYKAILDLLRKRDDVPMIWKVLLALRTSGSGNTMGRICSERRIHAQLIHLVFRLDPFDPCGLLATNNAQVKTKTVTFQDERSPPQSAVLDNSLPDAFLNLVLAMVSANSIFLAPALNALWRLIINTEPALPDHVKLFSETLNIHDHSDTSTSQHSTNTRQRNLDRNSRLHGTLSKILHLVPKGRTEIFPLIASLFPFRLVPLDRQVNYLKHCLIVLKYVPTMEQQFLHLCMDRCLEMDVEIRIAHNGLVQIEEVEKDDDFDEILNSNPNTPEKVDNAKEKEKELKRLEKQKSEAQKVDEMAEKLDCLMTMVFQYLKSSSTLKPRAIRQLYRMIIPAFDSVILTTHRSKYVQFIMLYLCGLDDDNENENESSLTNSFTSSSQHHTKLYREFASKLIHQTLDPYCATQKRQSATCYLASFVSRASFVCTETACEAVAALLRFAEAYTEAYPTEASARSRFARVSQSDGGAGGARVGVRDRVESHSLFYTVCQAAFYVMCFRGADCIRLCREEFARVRNVDEEEDDGEGCSKSMGYGNDFEYIDIGTERWTRLCSHHLQPLRYCLESVRGEFLFLAETFHLIEEGLLSKLITENNQMASGFKRVTSQRIQTAATLEKRRLNGVGGLGRGKNPLDSFFPFDPYLLCRSHIFVEPYYRHWEGPAQAETEAVTEPEDDESISSDDGSEVDENEDDDDDDDDDEESVDEDDSKGDAVEDEADNDEDDGAPISDDDNDDDDDNSSSSEKRKHESDASNGDTWVQELKRARSCSIVDDCW